jgi:hypothetical protein
MPVRLIKPYGGQAVNTVYFGTDDEQLMATGNADAQIELASDYSSATRIVTAATATMSRTVDTYWMNSASAQTLTVPMTGYLPVGSVRSVVQKGAGAFTLAPATGVTFSTALASYISKGVNNIAQIVKDGANSWTVFGGVGG